MKENAKSIKQRLLNLSKAKQIDYNNVLLVRYFHERFLYRLSLSAYRSSFYLKGGALLYALAEEFPRPTIDIDLLGVSVKSDHEDLINIFAEICQMECPEDGIVFDIQSIKASEIVTTKKYPGVRISFIGYLDTIRKTLQVDVGFGDTSTMQELTYPTLLNNLPGAKLCAYATEYVVAEKFHAMIFLAEINSRFKDFYDVYTILLQQSVDDEALQRAIGQTFQTRKTEYMANHPLFSADFTNDKNRLLRWSHFLKKIKVEHLDFEEVVKTITTNLQPIYQQLNGNVLNSLTFIIFAEKNDETLSHNSLSILQSG